MVASLLITSVISPISLKGGTCKNQFLKMDYLNKPMFMINIISIPSIVIFLIEKSLSGFKLCKPYSILLSHVYNSGDEFKKFFFFFESRYC